MVPWAHLSYHPKRHLEQFSGSCRAHERDQQTDRLTTLLLCSSRLLWLDAVQPNSNNNAVFVCLGGFCWSKVLLSTCHCCQHIRIRQKMLELSPVPTYTISLQYLENFWIYFILMHLHCCHHSTSSLCMEGETWTGGPPGASFWFYLRESFQSQTHMEKISYNESRNWWTAVTEDITFFRSCGDWLVSTCCRH